mgnify:CR=1 FL=1
MSVNPQIVKSRFEKSLNKYNENAIVQNIMADNICTALSSIRTTYNNVLELGCGSGLLTEKLLKIIKYQNYYANDITKNAERYIRDIIENFIFINGNALRISTNKKFDLIISNAMFQWLNLNDVLDKSLSLCDKGGILAFTTFVKGNFNEFTKISGLSLDYKSKSDILNIFENDYELLYCDEFEKKLTFNNPLEMLLHMKNTGVNSLSDKNWSIKDIKIFCEKMNKSYDTITLTYKPIILIFKKL